MKEKIDRLFPIEKRDSFRVFTKGTRNDLAVLFNELGYTVGAEIGVLKGEYSLVLCRTIPNLKLYCIDPWVRFRRYGHGRMHAYYEYCVKVLSPYNVEIMKMKSVEAASLIADGSLDFVYIDSVHDYDSIVEDLALWIPKVRRGGIISGHDYIVLEDFGIIKAVDEYVQGNGINEFYITQFDPTNHSPSWFWEKK